MKKVIIIFFLFLAQSNYSQEIDEVQTSKGNWLITNQFGIATLEADDTFKVRASIFEGLLGREFYLNNKFSIITGLEFLRVTADFQDFDNSQQFISNNHINVPISLKFYDDRNNKIALFAEIGFYGSYLLKSKLENVLDNETNEQDKLGFNFGQQFLAGLRFKLKGKFIFSISFKYKSDFASAYKDSKQQFEVTDFYAIQLGLAFNL